MSVKTYRLRNGIVVQTDKSGSFYPPITVKSIPKKYAGGWRVGQQHDLLDNGMGGAWGKDYDAIKVIAAKKTRSCRWQHDEDCYWSTSCGEAHVFETDGPEENKHKFCPYCGGKLVIAKRRKDE